MFNPDSPLLHFITSYGYIGLFGVVSVETFEFIFSVPIGPILIVLGNLAHDGAFNFYILWGIAWIAAMLGDALGYAVGRYAGRPILNRFSRRWLKPEKLAKAEAYFRRRGVWAVFVTRLLIASIAAVINVLAGISGMSFRRFWLAEASGQFIWAGAYLALGYFFGSVVITSIENLYIYFSSWLSLLLILLAALLFFWWFIRKRRKRA